MAAEAIKTLVEAPDGARVTFTTPERFVAGTFRLIRNGLLYQSSDDRFGWSEVDSHTVTLLEAPEADEVLQGIYTVLTSEGWSFDPEGAIP